MRISFSDFHESKDCAYCFEKCGSATAVSWNCNKSHPSKVVSLLWPQQTEDGCHQSMWNALFKPFRSDCDMTRLQAHQTLIYITWALCFTPLYHLIFSEFRKMYWQHFESLCHKWLNELCQNISTFESTLFWLFEKQTINAIWQHSVQHCRIMCVYRFKTVVIICIYITTWSCMYARFWYNVETMNLVYVIWTSLAN